MLCYRIAEQESSIPSGFIRLPDASLHWSNPRVAVLIHMKSAVVPVAFHRIGSQGTTCARRTVHLAVRFVCKTSIGRVLLLCLCEHLLVQALPRAHISMSINLIDHCGRAARKGIARPQCASTNLVDPASCHMLISRTKPCKCKSTCVSAQGGLCTAHYKVNSLPNQGRFLDVPTG